MTHTVNHSLVEQIAKGYAESNMRAHVQFVRIADPEVSPDDALLARAVPVRLVYIGIARVYLASGPSSSESTEESQYFSTSYISTPILDSDGQEVRTQVNDLCEVLAHTDPLMAGRVFRVMDVDAGGQWPIVRRHMVSGAQRYPGWTWTEE